MGDVLALYEFLLVYYLLYDCWLSHYFNLCYKFIILIPSQHLECDKLGNSLLLAWSVNLHFISPLPASLSACSLSYISEQGYSSGFIIAYIWLASFIFLSLPPIFSRFHFDFSMVFCLLACVSSSLFFYVGQLDVLYSLSNCLDSTFFTMLGLPHLALSLYLGGI